VNYLRQPSSVTAYDSNFSPAGSPFNNPYVCRRGKERARGGETNQTNKERKKREIREPKIPQKSVCANLVTEEFSCLCLQPRQGRAEREEKGRKRKKSPNRRQKRADSRTRSIPDLTASVERHCV